MAKMGFLNTSSDPYAYLEMPAGSGDAASCAVGLDNLTGTFNIVVNGSTGATPVAGQLNISGATNGNVTITPNGTGNVVLNNVYGTTLTSTQFVVINSSGVLAASTSGGGGVTWNDVTGTTQAMAVNMGYTANNASLVTLTLPSTAAYGTQLRVCGKGAGGWKIAQNAGQIIHFGVQNTTSGTSGYLASSQQYNAVELLCTVANTAWTVLSAQGNITFN